MTGRITLVELQPRAHTTREVAALSGVTEAEALAELQNLNARVVTMLGTEEDPITVTETGAWRVDGIAGLLRLNAQVEIEVVPKFLDASAPSWRADFFLLAVLVTTGHLLLADEISAEGAERGDLATLIARSLLALFEENQRRPIRGYKRMHRTDFSLDGEVDWESLVLPESNGFRLSKLELTRQNPYNATLAAAIRILACEVRDTDTEAKLTQLGRSLAPQGPAPAVRPPLPQRHSGWQKTYDLAGLVVDGLGLDLAGGAFTGPGFVLRTWSAWQTLCEEVMRRALPQRRVVPQKPWVLGKRSSKPVVVKPDLSVLDAGAAAFLLDAKYKTRAGRAPSIYPADVYESLAFLRAARTNYMGLLYPATRSVERLPLGAWSPFDQVVVDAQVIEGIEIQIQGIAARSGFDHLVSRTRVELLRRLSQATKTASSRPATAVQPPRSQRL